MKTKADKMTTGLTVIVRPACVAMLLTVSPGIARAAGSNTATPLPAPTTAVNITPTTLGNNQTTNASAATCTGQVSDYLTSLNNQIGRASCRERVSLVV